MRSDATANWDVVEGLFGVKTDREISELLGGVSIKTVARQRWSRGIPPPNVERLSLGIDWDNEKRLGKMTDSRLAKTLGCAVGSVVSARRARNIPAFSDNRKGIDWDAQPLGEQSDAAIAGLLGCNPEAVRIQRIKRGIASFDGKFNTSRRGEKNKETRK